MRNDVEWEAPTIDRLFRGAILIRGKKDYQVNWIEFEWIQVIDHFSAGCLSVYSNFDISLNCQSVAFMGFKIHSPNSSWV